LGAGHLERCDGRAHEAGFLTRSLRQNPSKLAGSRQSNPKLMLGSAQHRFDCEQLRSGGLGIALRIGDDTTLDSDCAAEGIALGARAQPNKAGTKKPTDDGKYDCGCGELSDRNKNATG
jgi:hypothetical protein